MSRNAVGKTCLFLVTAAAPLFGVGSTPSLTKARTALGTRLFSVGGTRTGESQGNMSAKQIAKNSMPGPDGVPSQAYKSVCDVSLDVLYDVYRALASDQAIDILISAFEGLTQEQSHDLNASILCLLPKKPTGVDDSVGTYSHPKTLVH